jgi:hypothetical protein
MTPVVTGNWYGDTLWSRGFNVLYAFGLLTNGIHGALAR